MSWIIDAEINQLVLEAIEPDSPNYIVEQLIPSFGKRILFLAGLKKHLSLDYCPTPIIVIDAESTEIRVREDGTLEWNYELKVSLQPYGSFHCRGVTNMITYEAQYIFEIVKFLS